MVGIAITRTDMSGADLRAAAKRSADAKQASRILAIAMVLDGFSRGAVLRHGPADTARLGSPLQ